MPEQKETINKERGNNMTDNFKEVDTEYMRRKKIGRTLKIKYASGERLPAMKGKHTSQYQKDAVSKYNKEHKHGFKQNHVPWNKNLKGTHFSPKTEFKKGMPIELHNNWHGGISFEPYTLDWTDTFKQSIRERDHYICGICKKTQGDRAFCVHHIDYNKKNCNPDNLITLCVNCHTKTSFSRKKWTEFFNNQLNLTKEVIK